jgi:type IV secretory pathway TrbF-like protein
MISSTPEKEIANPYLNSRRGWNGVWEHLVVSEKRWRIAALAEAVLLAFALLGLVILGSQPKTIPYVVQVDKLGEVAYSGRLTPATADNNVVRASIAGFISNLRLVTPDSALQAEAINRVYAYLSKGDPALTKVNQWYGGTKESSPYARAVDELVSVDIDSVLPQTANSWQVDWTETTRDRKGEKASQMKMRALLTIVTVPPTTATSENQLRRNPLGIYVQDVNWSRLE